jgi:protein TonB
MFNSKIYTMKTKTRQDRLEKQRRTFFLIGLIFALTVVLSAFEWKTYDITREGFTRSSVGIIDDELILITKHEKPEPPKPIIKTVAVIKEVPDDVKVDDVELFNPEADPTDSIPEYIFVPIDEPDDTDEEIPFMVVEKMPEFPGGNEALYAYLYSKASYTQMAKEANIQGTVYVGFIVEKDGTVTTVTLERGIGGGLDENVLEAVRNMPDWSPGKQRGIPVRVMMVVPFKFKLQ